MSAHCMHDGRIAVQSRAPNSSVSCTEIKSSQLDSLHSSIVGGVVGMHRTPAPSIPASKTAPSLTGLEPGPRINSFTTADWACSFTSQSELLHLGPMDSVCRTLYCNFGRSIAPKYACDRAIGCFFHRRKAGLFQPCTRAYSPWLH